MHGVRRSPGTAVHAQAEHRRAGRHSRWMDSGRRERHGPRAGAGRLRGGALVAALRLRSARAAPSLTLVALPHGAAPHQAHQPGARRQLRRRPGAPRAGRDRAARLAGDGRTQLGLRARRAVDLAARPRLPRGAGRVAGRRARAAEGGRADDAVGGQRRALARWPPPAHRRAGRARDARGRERSRDARCGWQGRAA